MALYKTRYRYNYILVFNNKITKIGDKTMRIAIIGSRTFNNYELMATYLNIIRVGLVEEMEIVSGGAIGADHLAEDYAENWELEITIFRPDWNGNGKIAGFIRNQEIIDSCDMVIAFWDGRSKGTKDSIDKARIAKKPTLIVYF